VGDDGYLGAGVLHWANVSSDQHRELTQYSKETGRQLIYLFITAHPELGLVRFWQVPAAVIEREFGRRGKTVAGSVMGLHISDKDGRHMLGEEDVTEHSAELKIDSATSSELAVAVRHDRKKKARVEPAGAIEERRADSFELPASDAAMRRFDIPISGGRIAVLSAPIPLTDQDLTRVKGYVDLMSDLLLSPLPRVRSPRLARPQDVAQFKKQVFEVPADANL
jgi:hypothetical protein